MPVLMEAAGEITSLASLDTLISGIKSAMTWVFSLFTTVVNVITSNDLLLYPVLLCIVLGAVGLVVAIIKKFGMKSRRS